MKRFATLAAIAFMAIVASSASAQTTCEQQCSNAATTCHNGCGQNQECHSQCQVSYNLCIEQCPTPTPTAPPPTPTPTPTLTCEQACVSTGTACHNGCGTSQSCHDQCTINQGVCIQMCAGTPTPTSTTPPPTPTTPPTCQEQCGINANACHIGCGANQACHDQCNTAYNQCTQACTPTPTMTLAPITPTATRTPRITPTPTRAANGNVLLLVGAAGANMAADDVAISNRLAILNYNVTPVYACSATAANASGKVLVIITATAPPSCFPSVWTSDTPTPFASVAVPVLVSKGAIMANLGLTGRFVDSSYGSITAETQITIVNPGHPLAAGASGTITVEGSPAPVCAWGSPNANAAKVASVVGNASRNTLFAYNKGAQMPGGPAAACRIGAFWSDGAPSNFNAQGWNLFDNTIDWATQPACR
jgi:hypothetical protein